MVCTWETATGRAIFQARIGKEGSRPAAFSPNGKALATVSNEGFVCVHDLPGGRELRRFPGRQESGQPQQAITAVTFAPDGRTLMAGYGHQSVTQFNRQFNQLGSGMLYSTAAPTGLVRIWELTSAQERSQIHLGSSAAPVLLSSTFRGGEGLIGMGMGQVATVSLVAPSPDGRTVAVLLDSSLILWDLEGNRELRRLQDVFLGGALTFSPDGRLLAIAGSTEFTLWNVATGKLLARGDGHHGAIMALAFSPDGKSLVSTAADTTAVVWDVQELLEQGRRQRIEPSAQRLQQLWADLARQNAQLADRASWALAAAPARSVPFLKARLRPVPAIDAAAIQKLVADLNSGRYAVRQKAMHHLEALGEIAEATLRKALEQGPSLELRRRVEPLLAKIEAPISAPEQLRALRAVEALERAGTKEARAVLAELAGGAPQARLTHQARDALQRLRVRD